MKFHIKNWDDMQEAITQIRGRQTSGKPFFIEVSDTDSVRTKPQNSAMWKYLTMLAGDLNEAGWDMRKTLKPTVDIPWTKDAAKNHLWLPIQKAMEYGDKTSQLNTKQVSEVYEVLNRHTAEKFGISIPFPSKDSM